MPSISCESENSAVIDFWRSHPNILVLTGAGFSAPSGIPDYRDANGYWKRGRPIHHSRFMSDPAVRRQYWFRSFSGWPAFAKAAPNSAHLALSALERAGHVRNVVTQNVDGLHQRAGSRRVVDLHGRLDMVDCQNCKERITRTEVQRQILALNTFLELQMTHLAPDGDALIDHSPPDDFRVPECKECGGVLKPNVVFFGGTVPKPRSALAMARLISADALVVAGSSLQVYSGSRFIREAKAAGIPVAVVGLGRTRADSEVDLKVTAACEKLFPIIVQTLVGC